MTEYESFMESIVEFLPDMVFLKDARDLRFVHLNRRAEEVLGYAREDLVGKSDYDFFPTDQADFFVRKDREVLAGGKVVDIAAEPIDTAYGPRILHTKKIPLFDSTGTARYLLGISEDITERHTAEAAASLAHEQHLSRISSVLVDHGFRVEFQPIFDLGSRHIVGVEALSRFDQAPERTPDHWFREAAEVGLGLELELAAIDRAVARMSDLPPNAYLSINASPATVTSGAIQDRLPQLAAERLVIELTEHADVADYTNLRAEIALLREAGVRIAVDDTGAGYSSLRHILHLQPDIIKLDMTLTRGIDSDPARRALASALLRFREEIGAEIVAEGIETEGELDTLQRLGLQFGQGFLLARPGALPVSNPLQ